MAIVTPLSALAPGQGGAKSLSLVDDVPAIKRRAVADGKNGLQQASEPTILEETTSVESST